MAKQQHGSREAEITVEEIRRWVEQHGRCPATGKSSVRPGEKAGLLRIDSPGFSGSLEKISDDFVEKFERAQLAFPYREGDCKLIARPAEVK